MQAEIVNQIFKSVDRPIWVITSASSESGKGGLIATWVSQASLDPAHPRVLAAISPMHHTHQLMKQSGKFVAHLLTSDEIDLVWKFGLNSGHQSDKFHDLPHELTGDQLPRLKTCQSYLECSIVTVFSAGDRTLFMAEITDGHQIKPEQPLLTESEAIRMATDEQKSQLKQQLDSDILIQADLWNAFIRQN